MLKAVGALGVQGFVAPRTGFFPSLKATLNHIVTVDWYYVDALERSLRGDPVNADARLFFVPEEPFAECDALSDAQHAVDRRLVDVCIALTGESLDTPIAVLRREGVVHEPLTRLLAHLFQHQIHHRGQTHVTGTQSLRASSA